MNDNKFRVYNACKYDIGVELVNGQKPVIRAGSFIMMTADDMAYIDSRCSYKRPFESGMLYPVDMTGERVNVEDLGLIVNQTLFKHYSDDEIKTALKQSVKKIEEWISNIFDPALLYNICKIAQELDCPPSKTKILAKANPNYIWDKEEKEDE